MIRLEKYKQFYAFYPYFALSDIESKVLNVICVPRYELLDLLTILHLGWYLQRQLKYMYVRPNSQMITRVEWYVWWR